MIEHWADPIITPLLIGGLATIGITGTTATIVAGIVSFVIAAGISLLAYALAPKPAGPEDVKIPVQQSVPPRGFVYGQARIAGAVLCYEEKDGDLFYIAAIASHEITSFDQFYLHEDRVAIDSDGVVSTIDKDDGRYQDGNISLYMRTGEDPSTAITEFVTGLGTSVWDSSHRGDGIALIGMICQRVEKQQFQKTYPFGAPRPSVVVKGAKVWDFRDSGQDPENPATWEYSENAALILAHFECFNEFGPRRDYTKAIVPVQSDWELAADICDENQALDYTSGSEKRYHIGGYATTENEPKAVRAMILMACDGWFVERGDGAIVLTVGKFPTDPDDATEVPVITDDDIIGFHVQNGVADEEVVNRLLVRFSSPDHDYNPIECDPFDDDTDQLARGKVREQTYDVTWAQSFTHARRLGKREMFRQSQRKRGYLDLKLSAINSAYKRWSKIESTVIPGLNGVFIENRSCRFNLMQGGFRMDFLITDNSIDTWDPATDEGTEPTIPDEEISVLPVPANVVAIPRNNSGGKILRVSFDTMDTDFEFRIRWRISDTDPATTDNQPGEWFEEEHTEAPTSTSGGTRLYFKTGPVEENEILDVQIAVVDSGDTLGAFSTLVTVDTTTAFAVETEAYLNAMDAPPTEAARTSLINTFIADLKSDGIFAKLDFLYLLAAHNSQAAKINVIDPGTYDATEVGTPLFTADGGFTGDGANDYLDTNFIPGVGTQYQQDSACFGLFSGTSAAAAGGVNFDMGRTSTVRADLRCRNAADTISITINDATGAAFANTDGSGFFNVLRSASNARRVRRFTVELGSDATVSTGVPNASFHVLASNGQATRSARQARAAWAGANLSNTESNNFSTRLNTYMTGL